jgi:hypothetical protein
MSRIKYIGRSALAFIAAFAVTSILTYLTDVLLVATNLMQSNTMPSSVGIIVLLVVYRTLYNVAGAFVLAKLAPSRPMTHVLVLGVLGAVGGLAAGASMPGMASMWYSIALAVLAIPSVWLGAKLAVKSK